jgi:hypothetical protein
MKKYKKYLSKNLIKNNNIKFIGGDINDAIRTISYIRNHDYEKKLKKRNIFLNDVEYENYPEFIKIKLERPHQNIFDTENVCEYTDKFFIEELLSFEDRRDSEEFGMDEFDKPYLSSKFFQNLIDKYPHTQSVGVGHICNLIEIMLRKKIFFPHWGPIKGEAGISSQNHGPCFIILQDNNIFNLRHNENSINVAIDSIHSLYNGILYYLVESEKVKINVIDIINDLSEKGFIDEINKFLILQKLVTYEELYDIFEDRI